MTDEQIADTPIKPTALGRLANNQTAVDFAGRRTILLASAVLIVITVLSLATRDLNLGIDFEGGVSYDVPAADFDEGDAEAVLADHDIGTDNSRIQARGSESGDFVKVQIGTQTEEVSRQLTTAFAERAGVEESEINVDLVSATWGEDITDKAIRALVIFIVVVAAFIAIRFEWRMALAAILAMLHDVVVSVGIYSIFQFVVTPETVIAFLTILGYSLYDTIVVFDHVRENEARFAMQQPPYDDIVNVSMNQVIVRSLATSFSSIVPVVSLLVVGAWVMGASTLSEFAIALLIGMVTGAYSSIFVATPLLTFLKRTDPKWRKSTLPRAVGEPLRAMVMGASMGGRRSRLRTSMARAVEAAEAEAAADAAPRPRATDPVRHATQVLSHPPRPSRSRNKKRR